MSTQTHPRTSTDPQYTGRPVNVGYLVVGLVFLGIAGVWGYSIARLKRSGPVLAARLAITPPEETLARIRGLVEKSGIPVERISVG